MGIKKFIFGDPEKSGMNYRIRVFDHGHHIKTATVSNRGQDRINLLVKHKDYYILGEEIKLAFMINPQIPPKYFGNTMEIDFDVRDATQLGDIFDLCPDLVYEINENFHDTLKKLHQKENNVIEAEFTEKTETKGKETDKGGISPGLEALTDPVIEKQPEPAKDELQGFQKQLARVPGVMATARTAQKISEVPYTIKTTIRGLNLLNQIRISENEEKQDLIKKTLDFCSLPQNQKCLRWLPKRLHIEPEIMAIVSQMELDGVGILPMYYIKQSTAEISEKMLARPKTPEDWKTTALYIIGILGALGLIVALLYILTHPGH